MTDADGKKNAVDDDDATRPATSSTAPDRAAAVQVEASPNDARGEDDAGPAAVPAGRAVLRRLAPEEGQGESIVLALASNLLGRSHTCNVPLFSATASRQHAEIVARNGEWVLAPADGKMVIVEGRPVFDEVLLQHEMRIRLGADELIFLQEKYGLGEPGQEDETHVTRSGGVSPTPARAAEPSRRSPLVWISVCGATLALAALALWLLL